MWAKETWVTSLLLEAGANPDLQNYRGESALMMAAREGKTETVSLLVKAGATLDLQNERGESALMMAVSWWWDKPEVFSLLLVAGANTDLQNKAVMSGCSGGGRTRHYRSSCERPPQQETSSHQSESGDARTHRGVRYLRWNEITGLAAMVTIIYI
jgi:hypothetical protein